MGEPTHRERRNDKKVLRLGRVVGYLVDTASQEGVARVRTGVGGVADTGVGELCPSVAAVRGFVYTDARLASGRAAVALTRAEVKRVPAGVVRIGDERADRVLREIGSQKRPRRIGGKGVVRPPDAASGATYPKAAIAGNTGRRDDQRRVAARRRGRGPGERQHTGLNRVLNWPVRPPVVVVPRGALLGDLVESVLGVLHHRYWDHVSRIGAHGGFVGLVTVYRSLARCSAGACQSCVQIANHLGYNQSVLRELARR